MPTEEWCFKHMAKCLPESGLCVDPPMQMLVLLVGNQLLICGMGQQNISYLTSLAFKHSSFVKVMAVGKLFKHTLMLVLNADTNSGLYCFKHFSDCLCYSLPINYPARRNT